MQIYNSMTRKKETFVPVREGKVSMYACGITAYDLCHIGHARSAIVFDVLARYLRHLKYDLTFVRNFTDVDDKIINRANELGVDSKEIAEKYMHTFHEDMDRLKVQRADIEPKATENINEMIKINEKLIADGNAYATASGDVYFRVRKFAEYGKLSGRSVDDLRSGARVQPGEEKEDPLDFALWKAAKPGEPYWDSPWGKGRPGWHIECSAMSERYLPLPLDIHGGGQDLIFPHHENEIAQTEACFGKNFCNYWVHNGFVQIDSEKMSKSLGNFKTIRDILEYCLPEVLRYFLLTRHYRSPIDFNFMAIDEAEKNVKKIYETLKAISLLLAEDAKADAKSSAVKLPESFTKELKELDDAYWAALDDDLNTAAALGHVFGIVHLSNRLLEDKKLSGTVEARALLKDIQAKFVEYSKVLGLFDEDPISFLNQLKLFRLQKKNLKVEQIEELMNKRLTARQNKDFALADSLRKELEDLGLEIRDTASGAGWDVV
ncbi:cysteine--tRNA ligase [Desulfovibrio litoralis]|uniref:Cysteine--tRNA ligase n=1 Tax=Desulfovibrio litoralis DSM 11393 TaxID=1121455 RepID=A0A1M7T127_9BACT|nr:cysteine--tRNA ligase [Desulfovibrio litoralis]SHN64475.1 cysteinyl-tRNA synthetase [Desulfovibrio litoralis DSM 11393]